MIFRIATTQGETFFVDTAKQRHPYDDMQSVLATHAWLEVYNSEGQDFLIATKYIVAAVKVNNAN